ncbi:restriction endonuclease [Salinisphaera sp. SWV1]|uniref:restriction endonuclease n=1 Tax=Salinisphaera sp. SWV1 TaxID=3454139 RepID=UPI003F866C51
MPSESTEFELFVRAVYQEILSLEGFETISVEHDVKITGRSGQKHQIDVYWEFKAGGITHKVAVECKHYKNTISLGKIRDFHSVVEDIGNTLGVFVTTKGYQSGAIKYAKHKDISLKTVSEPTEEELQSHQGIKMIGLQMHAKFIQNVRRKPEIDTEWLFSNTDVQEGDELSFNGLSSEVTIQDIGRGVVTNVHELENRLPREPENSKDLNYSFEFEEAFIKFPEGFSIPIKLRAFHFLYDTETVTEYSEIRFKLMAEAVLRDIITGESQLYGRSSRRE